MRSPGELMAETREFREQQRPNPGTPLDIVGSTLRKVYEADVAEPMPEAFEDLLRQLS